MQPRLTRLAVVAVAVAGFLTQIPRASAEVLTLRLDDNVPGTVGITLGTQSDNIKPGPYYWSDVNDPPTPGFPTSIATFCIELAPASSGGALQQPQIGNEFVFAVLPLEDPATTTKSVATDIKALYGNFYQTAWGNPSFNGDNESKAFQLALWELIYETSSTRSVNDGNFSSSSSAAGRANEMLNGLGGGLDAYNGAGYEVVALVAPNPYGIKEGPEGQDQITVRPKGVPAPPAVLLAGIGALALFGRARWNRRTPPAA